MLKHLPQKSLKVIQHDLLYSQKPVVIPYGFDRRVHGRLIKADKSLLLPVDRSDDNFDDREAKFRNQLKNKYACRVPLKNICDIGKRNFITKIDMKIRLTLETDMKKLFESNKSLHGGLKTGKTAGSTNSDGYEQDTAPKTPDVQIVLLKAPMIQYEQLALNTNLQVGS